MATFKIVEEPYTNPDDILREIKYICNPLKCIYKGFYNILSADDPITIYNQYLYIKHYFRKTSGRQLEHFILSFDNHLEEKDIDFHSFLRSTEWIISDLFPEYQIVYAFHSRPNIHVHLIMNSVNMFTGKHYHKNKFDFWVLMKDIATILKYFNIALAGYSYFNENGRFHMSSNHSGWLYENKLKSYL